MDERNKLANAIAQTEAEMACLNQARDRAALELEKLRSRLASFEDAEILN